MMDKKIISIITPFYNAGDYIEETAKSVLGQTFPLFEWIIVDDGSSEEHRRKLKKIENLDERIKIIWTEGEGKGPAVIRDIGIMNSANSSKYIVFLDADDLYDKTFLECCYWTLETHPDASWAYTDSINFGTRNFLWRKWYSVEWEKQENILIVSSCIKKEDLLEVGCFDIKEKNIYEDWYLWLKLIKAGKFPIRMNSLLTYYRQKEGESELKITNSKNRKNALELIENMIPDIWQYKQGIQFPKFDYNWDFIPEENKNIVQIKNKKDEKIHVLMIIPWMITGGADKFNLDLIKKIDKKKFEFTILTTLPSTNEWRTDFEKYATIYDLTTFLEIKDWMSFINYLIVKNNINIIFNSNSEYGYKILPYLKAKFPSIPIVDYVHMEEMYWRNGGFSRDSSAISDVIDKTFTCSENSRKTLMKNFGRKAKEIKTIYVGVDEEKFKKGTDPFLKENKFIITYICRIVDQKRPFLFFEICKKLSKLRKDFKVLVVGDGPLLDGLKSKVKENKMEKLFKFVGKVKNTKEIYEISDITVNTSIKEGVALTSFESLAMEVPVVSSDVGGQKELISEDVGVVVPCLQDEKDVLNFNYSDEEIQNYVNAINRVLDNIEFYKSNCRKRIIKKFTINKMVKNMEEELRKVAESPNENKIKNGEFLSKNINVLKEFITTYLMLSKPEYEWLANQFNEKNIHKEDIYEKKAKKMMYYEHTLEYKLKHPIVVILRKMGIYNQIKKALRYGVNKV